MVETALLRPLGVSFLLSGTNTRNPVYTRGGDDPVTRRNIHLLKNPDNEDLSSEEEMDDGDDPNTVYPPFINFPPDVLSQLQHSNSELRPAVEQIIRQEVGADSVAAVETEATKTAPLTDLVTKANGCTERPRTPVSWFTGDVAAMANKFRRMANVPPALKTGRDKLSWSLLNACNVLAGARNGEIGRKFRPKRKIKKRAPP